MDVKTIISRYAEYYGHKTAIVYGENRLSFREVNERSNRLANGLLELGVRHSDRVGTIIGNCPHYIEAMFAKHKMGAVDVILSPRLSSADLEYQIHDSGLNTLIVAEEYLSKIPDRSKLAGVKHFIALSNAPEGWVDYESLLAGSSTGEPKLDAAGDELGHIVYTAGTTGKPKGIMWRRTAFLFMGRNLLLDLIPELSDKDVFLGLQPLYHAVSPFVLPCWIRGSTHVIVDDFSAEVAFPAIEKEGVTVIKTVPTLINRYIAHPDISKYDFSMVHSIIYGASPMSVEKLKEAIRIFGRVFIQNYGQSEAPMTICCLHRDEHFTEGKPEEVALLASVGRPYTMVDVKIVDDGNEVAPGGMGEVIVRGDHTMIGYLNRPEETSATLKDGWVYTGDIGKISNGYVFLTDRKGEMIITGGLNVYPGEVEQVLCQHPAVFEACVFGVPDENWGEAVQAAITLKPGMAASEQEIIEFCKKHLAGYKKPQSVEFLDDLPKSPQGKILRRALRDPYWKGHDRKIE